MPGITGVHHGARRQIRISQENDYGIVNPAPSWQTVPYLGDGFKLKASSPLYTPDTNYGGWVDKSIAIAHRQEVAGDLVTLPWPQITLLLLDMALQRDAGDEQDLYSYTVDHYTPVDPRRYRGTVAESLRIAVTGTGDGEVQLTVGLRAQDETENDGLVPGDFSVAGIDQVPFMHAQSVLKVNAGVVADVESWTLSVTNTMESGPLGPKAGVTLGVVGFQVAGQREVTLDINKLNRSDLFNRAIREALNISFEATFTHPLGHVLQIQLPKLAVSASDEDATPSRVAKEAPRMVALADAAGHCVVYAVDLSPATTMAPLTTTAAATTTTTGT